MLADLPAKDTVFAIRSTQQLRTLGTPWGEIVEQDIACRKHRRTCRRGIATRRLGAGVQPARASPALLALVEAAIIVGSVYAAILVRFDGISAAFASFDTFPGPIWTRALAVAGVFLACLA